MKNIVLIAHSARTAYRYTKLILSLFGSRVRVESYSLDGAVPEEITADVVLVSTHSIYSLLESRLKNCRHVVIADITLCKSSLEPLRSLPTDTKAMLVNTTLEMAVDTIRLIHNAGINHIELVPVYPGMEEIPKLDLAITPGEPGLVPAQVSQVIDLDDRVLSMQTITNLAAKLELTDILQQEHVKAYVRGLVQSDLGIDHLLNQLREQERKLDIVTQVFDGGIMMISKEGTISFLNAAAEQLLQRTSFSLVGQPVETVIPELVPFHILRLTQALRDQVITLYGQQVDISFYPLVEGGNRGECLLMLKTVEEVEQNQYQIRRQVMRKGHVAKHTFADIKTQSPKMIQLKEAARSMAQSSSSIVIYGQSGTGKELFAQSIHNASPRRDYPFIAINCASIPETLLESELFGYSEGAFTGAKKGGKLGYFELAHKGTLFLDEIGEMEPSLQSRILRVLQEKEVTRIGGDSVISVDVRIISASNKRLLDLVRQNRFRPDLYYRLNVLSLEIPPLCERAEDIPLLISDFQSKMHTSFSLSPEAMEFLSQYPWRGNIRELGNFVERISYLGTTSISLEVAKSQLDDWPEDSAADRGTPLEQFIRADQSRLEQYAAILSLLLQSGQSGCGRAGISQGLRQMGLPLSEQQVRSSLQVLQRYHFVAIQSGRRGTTLTPLGVQAAKKLVGKLGK